MNEPNNPTINSQPTDLTMVPSLYLLQVNGNSSKEPIHMLANELNQKQAQYLVPILPTLQNCTQQNLQVHLGNGDRWSIVNYLRGHTPQEMTSTPKQQNVSTNIDSNINSQPEQPTTCKRAAKKQKQTVFTSTDNYINSQPERPTSGRRTARKQKQANKTEQTCQSEEKIHIVQNYVHIPDRVVPARAVAVLPMALQYRRGCVSARRALPPRVRFGPVQGIFTKIFKAEADEMLFQSTVTRTPVFLCRRDEESVTQINVLDKDKANWLSLLPLGDESTANVWLYEEDKELYAVTIKEIPSRIPLTLGYSKKYAEEHDIPPGFPVIDLNGALAVQPKKWWCMECRHAAGSSALLQRHISVYHKNEKPRPRKYRCSYCSRTFSRLFSLKRHMVLRFCTKKIEKFDSANEKAKPKREETPYNVQNIDDSRIPSDESFQNYTAGLDFSTSLFDADRILKLDIIGSSRSETDFNPYKLENFDNNSDLTSSFDIENVKKKVQVDESIETCSFCETSFPKSKKRRHVRDCTARRQFQCGCGQVFIKKKKLAQHIYCKHVKGSSSDFPNDNKEETTDTSNESTKGTPYKCDDCKLNFKRRGMLVNHLWRVHNKGSAEVPLEKRVKHYPCVTCPNIYSTAAKRDSHVRIHHPDAKTIRAAPIEGETLKCEPAACFACPRQYTTRAKLLQHLRAHHPHLAVPTKTKTPVETPQENHLTQSTPNLRLYC